MRSARNTSGLTPDDVRNLRQQLRLTQVGLASAIGVVPSTVAKWEQGRVLVPPIAVTVLKLLARDAGLTLKGPA